MSTIRVLKDANYSTVANAPFNDTSLTWEARGMLAYLLTKPDNWTVQPAYLVTQGPGGRDRCYRILSELERAGYFKRTRHRGEHGQWVWEQQLHEAPFTEKPDTDKPDTDKPEIIESIQSTKTERIPALANAHAAPPASRSRKLHPDTRVVLDLYREALGYALPNGGADATAASWMLGQGFTPSEIIGTYHRLKLEPFWEDRHLGLQSVKKQIGAMVRRSAPAPTATPAAPSFEYDESYLRTAARS